MYVIPTKNSLCYHTGYVTCGVADVWHFENEQGEVWEEHICPLHVGIYVNYRLTKIDEYWKVLND